MSEYTFTSGQKVEWRSGRVIESGTYVGPDQWGDRALVAAEEGEYSVRADVLRPAGVLAAEDAALADLTERAKGYPIGDDEHAARRRKHGLPWCDTCKRPSVANEGQGLLHSTAEHPYGVPRSLDDSDHEVTHHEWYQVPRS